MYVKRPTKGGTVFSLLQGYCLDFTGCFDVLFPLFVGTIFLFFAIVFPSLVAVVKGAGLGKGLLEAIKIESGRGAGASPDLPDWELCATEMRN